MRYWELAADVVDVDVAQAGGGGVSHLVIVVDGDVAVEDLLEEVFICLLYTSDAADEL